MTQFKFKMLLMMLCLISILHVSASGDEEKNAREKLQERSDAEFQFWIVQNKLFTRFTDKGKGHNVSSAFTEVQCLVLNIARDIYERTCDDQIEEIRKRETDLKNKIDGLNKNLFNVINTYNKEFKEAFQEEFDAEFNKIEDRIFPHHIHTITDSTCNTFKDASLECAYKAFTNFVAKKEEYINNLEEQLEKEEQFNKLKDELRKEKKDYLEILKKTIDEEKHKRIVVGLNDTLAEEKGKVQTLNKKFVAISKEFEKINKALGEDEKKEPSVEAVDTVVDKLNELTKVQKTLKEKESALKEKEPVLKEKKDSQSAASFYKTCTIILIIIIIFATSVCVYQNCKSSEQLQAKKGEKPTKQKTDKKVIKKVQEKSTEQVVEKSTEKVEEKSTEKVEEQNEEDLSTPTITPVTPVEDDATETGHVTIEVKESGLLFI